MAAPLILVSPSIEKRGVEFHDLSISLSIKYDNAILNAGGIPVTVSTSTDSKILTETLRRVDGVLLTGGDDINPDIYEKKLPAKILRTIDQTPDGGARDLRELILIDEIFRQRKPLLAICRGHQILNVALGGTLFADIPSQAPGAMRHSRLDKPNAPVHEVTLTRGSLLAKIVGAAKLAVNSSHHQAVRKIAGPLMATARSSDGIVEAMELKPEAARRMPFLLSVQFHPERLEENFAQHRAIFQRFVEACARKKKS
ncbi:MAG TPA: gamma-glutamyl-gamma-aminobutyrate hydrolase family protein [Verrucomicrobiae bacterium]|nr:gamma-glutamyl-gamma-aminobutyrate hydrolase family protein [Verrucomicrobiae bacterium]